VVRDGAADTVPPHAGGQAGTPSDALRDRGLALGIDLERASRVALVEAVPSVGVRSGGSAGEGEELAEALGRALAGARVPHLAGAHGDAVALVVQDDPDIGGVLQEVAGPGRRLVCGIGRAVRGPHGLGRSLRDAQVALEQARTGGGAPVVRYDDLDLISWLVLEAGADAVRAKAGALLAPLTGRPDLYATLIEYLRQGLDVPASARALHVHQNSMRYRLGRIEELLGRSLHDAADLAAIHVALLMTSAAGTPSASTASSDSV
jgi:purine catabolism regulator